jgi:hypothetical protein
MLAANATPANSAKPQLGWRSANADDRLYLPLFRAVYHEELHLSQIIRDILVEIYDANQKKKSEAADKEVVERNEMTLVIDSLSQKSMK